MERGPGPAPAAAAGGLVVYINDVRTGSNWFGRDYQPGHLVIATLQEPVVEKPASYKALATVNAVGKNKAWEKRKGKVILYFQKTEAFKSLPYGQQVLIGKALQPIKNSGNPGGFDYERYSLFQGITHQAYVTGKEVALLPQRSKGI
ncbi:MAG: ComEC/Rec2 family competence protein [Chitinophagaceae bacterium]